MIPAIDIYLDTCDLNEISLAIEKGVAQGFTTNPTLMRRAGVTNYEHFARNLLQVVGNKPVAFEVVSEDPEEIYRQAMKIQSWGENVNVKVPFFNSQGVHNLDMICRLMLMKVHVNITALISLHHVSQTLAMIPDGRAILSVFAGRLADTGQPPVDSMREAAHKLQFYPGKKLLWASVREPVNIREAFNAKCDIITVPPEMLKKAATFYGMDDDVLAIATSAQFANDALAAGLTL